MISCREVTRTISSGELEAAAWPRRLRVQLHLLMCRHCRRYTRQLKKLGAAARDLWGGDSVDGQTLEEFETRILASVGRAEPTQERDPTNS